MQKIDQIFSSLSTLVGNTPLLQITYLYRQKKRHVFVKAENYNLTGSVKDRMALHILRKAYEKGDLREGMSIVEATSGNTGISMSAIGRRLGHPVIIFMPDWMSEERKNLIKSFGADIRLVSAQEGGFLGSIERSKRLAQERGKALLPCQFSNPDNTEAHELGTATEIIHQMEHNGITPHGFVAGVGTGGTIMGVGRKLRHEFPNIKIFPLEPANSPTLSTGHKVGKHRIQGISDEFIPPIVELKTLDEIVGVDDGDAIYMAQRLAKELGLGVGISSGANLLGAIKMQQDFDLENIVTLFPDDNKKYLSTDLGKSQSPCIDYLSTKIEFLGLEVIRRSCKNCTILH